MENYNFGFVNTAISIEVDRLQCVELSMDGMRDIFTQRSKTLTGDDLSDVIA